MSTPPTERIHHLARERYDVGASDQGNAPCRVASEHSRLRQAIGDVVDTPCWLMATGSIPQAPAPVGP
jgi:hypothetical protein